MNVRKKFSGQFIAISLFLVVTVFGMISGFKFEYTKYNEYKAEIASLNDQIETTDSKIKNLRSTKSINNETLEKTARKRLNMVKPNETVYIDINQ
ncbi:septum formation initiator family protein [Clostridioides mangenotii]|uniref:FtsB family cell division protein n=1 Tax=Metaclostridioides mangenotii TaxID=1540 RepID=UPI001C10E9C2|nr:septum formation initiator family protein [Clostridioides mangenotii]MBU5308562.1 septum formation initiator family protein [Clostridioides mangenotii]MCR1953387.1 septum formation initiator family protein [Clostridioides mangenotii]